MEWGPLAALVALYAGLTVFGRLVRAAKAPNRSAPMPRPTGGPQTLDELWAEMLRGKRSTSPSLPGPRTTAPVARPDRTLPEVSLDQESFEVVARRRQDATARDREWQPSDHEAFDRRIRETTEPAVATAGQPGLARLRRAMVWTEVLGTPVALRRD
jgi:hypothetical protein